MLINFSLYNKLQNLISKTFYLKFSNVKDLNVNTDYFANFKNSANFDNVIYYHFEDDHHFMQRTQQFDLIDVMNDDVNHHVNEKCE